jgi:DNA-3-methyladenine glycosylase I
MTDQTSSPVDAAGLITAPDGQRHCAWGVAMRAYHDGEWGRPIADDRLLFEKICLEGFQSGLSWQTILNKRDNFRAAFAGFDIARVAAFTEADVDRLMADTGIVRNRAKIASTINNAKRARALIDEAGSLAAWLWAYAPKPEERPAVVDLAYVKANPTVPASVRLSKELKRRGWTFVGPTTLYAFMQSVGFVNDHLAGCACREPLEAIRAGFSRPK